MKTWSEFVRRAIEGDAQGVDCDGRPLVSQYSQLESEYAALSAGCALVDRSYRGLLEMTGKDRAEWLHNLTTNHVKTLRPGEGNYAFACNIQGRIEFDLNILVREDCIQVDLDRSFLSRAMSHFSKYLVMEDVAIADRSDEFVRLSLSGAGVSEFLNKFGADHAGNLPYLATTSVVIEGVKVDMVRHDFCGSFAVELFVPVDHAVQVWKTLSVDGDESAAVPVGDLAVQIRRIEAGLPWSGREIADEVLPAETCQLERAVSHNKGCYLGQEVVERMRSRGVVAKQLVGLKIAGDPLPPCGASIEAGEKEVGTLTSRCRSLALGAELALAYVKSEYSSPSGTLHIVWDDSRVAAEVIGLPVKAAVRCD